MKYRKWSRLLWLLDEDCGFSMLVKMLKGRRRLDRIYGIYGIFFPARIPDGCGQRINCSRSIKGPLFHPAPTFHERFLP